jgi:uncharacterized membrane protein
MRISWRSQQPAVSDTEARVRGVERLISGLLRAGVLMSLTIIIAGTLMTFVHHSEYLWSDTALQHLAKPGAAFPHTQRDVWFGVTALEGQAVVTLGLLLLIATPVLRVAISMFLFIYQRDWTYALITLAVLSLLLLSFGLGKIE